MRIVCKVLLLSLLLFFKDHNTIAQSVSYCELLATERAIDSLDIQLRTTLEDNWKAIEKDQHHRLHAEILSRKETYSSSFTKSGLPRPSQFEANNQDCNESHFSKEVETQYLNLLIEAESNLAISNEHYRAINEFIKQEKEDDVLTFGVDSSCLWGKILKSHKATYTCVILDPQSKQINLQFLLISPEDQSPNSFQTILDSIENTLVLMNAGMFNNNYSPQGLFIAKGKKIKPLNMDRDSIGNFYLDPAGVFLINKQNKPSIITRDSFQIIQERIQIKDATQSGPMLLIDGKIHPRFNEQSTNFNIRNGVGITSEGNLVFIISNQPVNFYRFASVFKESFGCKNALYLDGAISKMYAPAMGRKETGGRFGPMIAITKTQN